MEAALDRAGADVAITVRIAEQLAGCRRGRHVGQRPTRPIVFFRVLESCRSLAPAEGTDMHVTCVSSPVIQSWYELTFWMAGSHKLFPQLKENTISSSWTNTCVSGGEIKFLRRYHRQLQAIPLTSSILSRRDYRFFQNAYDSLRQVAIRALTCRLRERS